ncbi:exodeoxyribonuclease VII large subunit [bacterium]|nr:exodeoxyribonuclease VII large subunit [bacterium]
MSNNQTSNDQLHLSKWSTLLEPGPQSARKKAEVIPSVETKKIEEAPAAEILTVSSLNQMIKQQIEGNFQSIWLQGEISNFKAHTSGHYYFSLKDDKSQISAVMFKGFNGRLKFQPDSGMEVIVRGRVTVYEPRGNYQIFCESMEPVGAGALQRAYEQLKNKLQLEGLFNPEHKQKIPLLPKSIGVVTSPSGAAIQDILNILGRRYRSGKITVIPARVQGEGAAQEVVRGIQLANSLGGFDVLIVGRGGGSIEDMWCFNEEIVARAIFASKIPIISAVGHEIDFTIADFVADVRAPTPSAAAELVAKSAVELEEKIRGLQNSLRKNIQHQLSLLQGKLNQLQSQLVDPKRRLQDLAIRCDELQQRLVLSWQRYVRDQKMQLRLLRQKVQSPKTSIEALRQRILTATKQLTKETQQTLLVRQKNLSSVVSMLDSLSPLRVVGRGYALLFDGDKIIKNSKQVKKNQELDVQLAEGALRVSVIGPTSSKFEKTKE